MTLRFTHLVVAFVGAALGVIVLRENAVRKAPEPEVKADAPISVATAASAGSVALRREADGHYWTTAYVNGMPLRFMVDTGASIVALTPQDARRAGLDPEHLARSAEVHTAGGVTKAARVNLSEVRIEGLRASNVAAVVMDEGLQQSLLGECRKFCVRALICE